MNNSGSKKKNRSLYLKFFSIVFTIVGSFLALLIVGIIGYTFMNNDAVDNKVATESGKAISNTSEEGNFFEKMFLPPKKTKFLVLGLDKSQTLSDSIFVGCFDRDSKKINVISIPRDTYVQMSQATIQELKKLGRRPPANGIMKMNAVHAYAGQEHGAEYAQRQIEELMGIKIDYYVEVNINAFKDIVDAVGGISMDIPAGGLYYDDPAQNLHISIPAGRQVLNGDMAEGVVRYRKTYKRGDLQRIEMQQQFMKEFFNQVLSKETIKNNLVSIISTLIGNVKTNFGVDDLPKYMKYINKLNSESISFTTLPGAPQMINGASYYLCDKTETAKLVDEVFYSKSTEEPETIALSDSKELKIQILNGSGIDGLAGIKRDTLKDKGYNVISIGNYDGTQLDETRIMVKEKGIGQDLKEYFNDAVIEIDEDIPESYDIIVITGLNEKNK